MQKALPARWIEVYRADYRDEPFGWLGVARHFFHSNPMVMMMSKPITKPQLASDLEQEIGDLLRSKGVLMDGYTLRKVAEYAGELAESARFKNEARSPIAEVA